VSISVTERNNVSLTISLFENKLR